jgi:tRNA-dihydrouridine synthase A
MCCTHPDRYFLRRFSKHTWLYTEMVTCSAILDNEYRKDQHLKFFQDEHPIALQLGGSDPATLAKCAAIGESYGYDEINLNVGCPSERVTRTKNSFGACLMASPDLVAACVAAIKAAVSVPVTVKHRIGIDGMESYEQLCHFVRTVHAAGCDPLTLNPKPETRNPKPETRNAAGCDALLVHAHIAIPEPQTLNPKP